MIHEPTYDQGGVLSPDGPVLAVAKEWELILPATQWKVLDADD